MIREKAIKTSLSLSIYMYIRIPNSRAVSPPLALKLHIRLGAKFKQTAPLRWEEVEALGVYL